MTVYGTGEHAVIQLPRELIRERLAGLREQTASDHDAVERQLDIVNRLRSRGRYIALLARLYGLYVPLETELGAAVARWRIPFDFQPRRKAPRIAHDLAALGMSHADIEALSRCFRVPRPASRAATLGCLYVVEGATLGGRVISRQIEQKLGIGPENGAAFFSSYGPELGERWQTFCSVLADALHSVDHEGEIVGAARETFFAFSEWMAGESAPL